jgi:formiminotetrahydrofolate cyclodeaminase
MAEVLRALASPHDVAGGGGPAAALMAATAAALTTKVARASKPTWIEAGGAIARGEALRAQTQALIEHDADAYARAASALAHRGDVRSAPAGLAGPGVRQQRPTTDSAVHRALTHAADIPLAIAEAAAEIAQLAAEVAARCPASMRPDALTAVAISEAATRCAALLVDINRGLAGDDPRRERAHEAQTAAAEALVYAFPAVSPTAL